MHRRAFAFAAPPLLLLAALAVTGCSDDSGDPTTPNTARSEVDGGEADTGGSGQSTVTTSSDAETGGDNTNATQGNQMPGGPDDTTPSTADGTNADG